MTLSVQAINVKSEFSQWFCFLSFFTSSNSFFIFLFLVGTVVCSFVVWLLLPSSFISLIQTEEKERIYHSISLAEPRVGYLRLREEYRAWCELCVVLSAVHRDQCTEFRVWVLFLFSDISTHCKFKPADKTGLYIIHYTLLFSFFVLVIFSHSFFSIWSLAFRLNETYDFRFVVWIMCWFLSINKYGNAPFIAGRPARGGGLDACLSAF